MGNAFFSGSVKQFMQTIPMLFPANLVLDDKMKPIDPQTATWKSLFTDSNLTIDVVTGYIEDEKYQRSLFTIQKC